MKKSLTVQSPRKMGRPLSFDRDAALRKAMLVFWRFGYETASITDLTAAMGVTAPSIYAAFGDKKHLFLEAVRLYAGSDEERGKAIFEAQTSYDAARNLLLTAAQLFTGETTPPGCLLASSTATGSEGAADVRAAVTKIRSTGREALRRRIERDIDEGKLPKETHAGPLADMIFALIQGMSVLARDGAAKSEIVAIASQAIAFWPKTPS